MTIFPLNQRSTATAADVYTVAGKIQKRVDIRDTVTAGQVRHLTRMGASDRLIANAAARGQFPTANHADALEARMLWREGLRLLELHDAPEWMGGWGK
jgi:hypothetical protein